MLKCRPPNNRTPEPREVEACRPYLDRQIALIRPRLIVALGKSAATTLLGVDATIASLRGRVHRYRGVPLVVTYHPAYLLRNLPDKAKAWEDLLLARRTLRERGRCRRRRDLTRHRVYRRTTTCLRGRSAPISRHAGACACAFPIVGGTMIRKLAGLLAVVATLALAGCGYNDLQRQDEGIKAAWSEVLNQYQRRADLVPNLVNTVKGYAAQEEKVLIEVTNARASVAGIKATPELINDPVAFQKFIQAQGELQGALSRLLVVAENYPQLKSDALFRDLTAQLEGTENRITVARNRYIKTVQEYNTTVRQFPTNLTAMLFKMDVKPNFAVDERSRGQRAAEGRFQQAGTRGASKPTQAPAPDAKGAPAPDAAGDLLKKGY